jgi:hypothetical protein
MRLVAFPGLLLQQTRSRETEDNGVDGECTQGGGTLRYATRALPWARIFNPFRVAQVCPQPRETKWIAGNVKGRGSFFGSSRVLFRHVAGAQQNAPLEAEVAG